ncbi:hypothetical protein [Lacibacter sp.]|uniref:hypothetical protein n=1 Tax=Lacibacter sp. TaxID=1915409 RepID=UPI002B4AF8F1|nr:hypothetical protein [Lacibacter sp.]HLP39366.1 hypothetical protein [Lacibacter sp.]
MHQLKRIIFILLLSPAFAGNAQTKSSSGNPKPVRFLLGAAFEFGGDNLAEVYFTDGSVQKMNSGQGGTLFAGGQLRLNKSEKLFLRGSVGIKYLTTKADNAHIRLTRIPLQLSLNYMPVKKWRFATGIVSHQAINLKFDGLGQNAKFTASPGLQFEAGYGLFALSYTLMKYKDADNATYKANAVGVTISGVF